MHPIPAWTLIHWTQAMALAVAVLLLTMAACDRSGAGGSADPPGIALQTGDLPEGLERCAGSGAIESYLRALGPRDQAARDELGTAWRDLQRQGADRAALTVYAAQKQACTDRLGTGNGVTVASLVVHFRNDDSAAAAYERGFLGFTTPGEDQIVDGMSRGAATGIGRNAWILQQTVAGRLLTVGLWERRSVLVLFLAVDEDPLHARQALLAVDRRIP